MRNYALVLRHHFLGHKVASIRFNIEIDDNIIEDCWKEEVTIEVAEQGLNVVAQPISNRRYLTKTERKMQEEESKLQLIKALQLKHTTVDDLDKVLEAIKDLPNRPDVKQC
jgi:hypothetical protein